MAALRGAGRGKSGLHGGTVPGNARRGRPQGKCHRKDTAEPIRHAGWAARVKRCGKSAPRRRQRRRQGKPHREQDQVGAAGAFGAIRWRQADLRAAARVGRTRRSATGAPEEWPSPRLGSPQGARSRHRTRLMRRLAPVPQPAGGRRDPSMAPLTGRRGRFGGQNRDNSAFRGKSLWIANCGIVGRADPASLGRWSTRRFLGRGPSVARASRRRSWSARHIRGMERAILEIARFICGRRRARRPRRATSTGRKRPRHRAEPGRAELGRAEPGRDDDDSARHHRGFYAMVLA